MQQGRALCGGSEEEPFLASSPAFGGPRQLVAASLPCLPAVSHGLLACVSVSSSLRLQNQLLGLGPTLSLGCFHLEILN